MNERHSSLDSLYRQSSPITANATPPRSSGGMTRRRSSGTRAWLRGVVPFFSMRKSRAWAAKGYRDGAGPYLAAIVAEKPHRE